MARRRGGLTPKQEAFVREYLIDLNATQAAVRAGYSPRTANEQGARLLANVSVRAAIETAQAERSRRTQIDADRVLLEIARLAFSDLRKVASWGPAVGVRLLDSAGIPDDAAAAVSEVSMTPHGPRVKLHSKAAALDKLARHLNLYKEQPPLEVLLAALPPDLGAAVRRELGRLLAGGAAAPGGDPADAADGPR